MSPSGTTGTSIDTDFQWPPQTHRPDLGLRNPGHGLAQAMQYRHFIRAAPAVRPWFESFGLDAKACRAVVAFPAGAAATAARVAELTELAKLFDVAVVELPPL